MTTEVAKQEKKEITVLGDNQVFIKRTKNGALQAVKGNIRLEEKKGHIANIQGKGMVTSGGFYELNKLASLSIITPEKLTLPDGKMVVNPYPIIDPQSGTISKVWSKKMAVGFSPIGNMVITSATLLYDIQMYFIQDLAKKVQFNKDAGRVCIESMLTDEERKLGPFFKIEGNFGVWVDFNNKEILKALDTFIQNKLFAERKAQTICERLVMRKHPALSSYAYVDMQGPDRAHWSIAQNVIGYCHDFDQDELINLAERAANGEDVTYQGQKVEVHDTTIQQIDEEDIHGAAEDEEVIINQTTEGNDGQMSFGGDLL